MKPVVSVAVAAALSLVATSAFAADAVTAKLAAPLKARTMPVAGGAVFACEADTCVANSPGADTNSLRACRELANRVGALTSFGTAARPLAADRLATCNTSAKK